MPIPEKLTHRHLAQLLECAQQLRDRIALDIHQGTLRGPTAGEQLVNVTDLINEVKPILYPQRSGPPAGMVDRRGQVH